MKRSIPLLIVIGIAAALCAAILVTSLRTDSPEPETIADQASVEQITILVAAADLKAMAVLEADAVATEVVDADRAPKGHLTNGVEVIGQVLAVPVVKGQAFTARTFATKGTGVHLASTLANGMRAVSISLTNYSGMAGLLYPGAVVDVLAAFRRPRSGDNQKGEEPVSTALMRGILVLAIEDRTVVSEDQTVPNLDTLTRGRRRMITLMVTPKQAESLHLATEHGSVSLSLRNPLDPTRPRSGFTALSELLGTPQAGPMQTPAVMEGVPTEIDDGVGPTPTPMWNVTVFRGGAAQVQQFMRQPKAAEAHTANR